MAEENRTAERLRLRADYINALPAGKQECLRGLMRRADTLGNVLLHLEDTPVPNAEIQAEMVELVAQEHKDARALLDYTRRAYGVPDLPEKL